MARTMSGAREGIADCLAHAVRWDGVFGGNLLIGFACFDSVEPGEGVGDIAQECAVDGFRGVAQNELGLDAASTQAERCEDAECILANAGRSHREASSERIAVEQDGHRRRRRCSRISSVVTRVSFKTGSFERCSGG